MSRPKFSKMTDKELDAWYNKLIDMVEKKVLSHLPEIVKNEVDFEFGLTSDFQDFLDLPRDFKINELQEGFGEIDLDNPNDLLEVEYSALNIAAELLGAYINNDNEKEKNEQKTN